MPVNPTVTVRHAGYYRITLVANVTLSAGTGDTLVSIFDGDNGNTGYGHAYFNLIPMATPQITSIVYLRAGTEITPFFNNNTGAVVNGSINAGDTYLLVERLT